MWIASDATRSVAIQHLSDFGDFGRFHSRNKSEQHQNTVTSSPDTHQPIDKQREETEGAGGAAISDATMGNGRDDAPSRRHPVGDASSAAANNSAIPGAAT